MKLAKGELVMEVIVFMFVVLFLYAAGSKLMECKQFVGQMGKSPLCRAVYVLIFTHAEKTHRMTIGLE